MAVTAENGKPASDIDALGELASRLSDPQTIAAVNSLLDNLPLIAILVRGLDEFVRRADVVADTVSDSLREVKAGTQATGMNIRDTSAQLSVLIPAFAEAAPAIKRIVESTIVGEDAVAVVDDAAAALIEGGEKARRENVRVGVGGLMKATRDKDFQRGMGMMVEVLTALGRKLGEAPSGAQPTGN